jgi:NAD(P)H-dependent FMN reductase
MGEICHRSHSASNRCDRDGGSRRLPTSTIPVRLSHSSEDYTSPGVPVPKGAYGNTEIDAWSQKIAEYDGFVFVIPQYNWSVPGVLRLELDHLFYEWVGKPIAIVSYGGRGGAKAATALTEIWQGVRGGEVVGKVELAITEGMELAQRRGNCGMVKARRGRKRAKSKKR